MVELTASLSRTRVDVCDCSVIGAQRAVLSAGGALAAHIMSARVSAGWLSSTPMSSKAPRACRKGWFVILHPSLST